MYMAKERGEKSMATEKLLSFREEIRTYQFWKAARCEFLITLLYVFIGCGSLTEWGSSSSKNELKTALAFGLATASLVQCVGHISGAHMNPAVTLAMLVTRSVTVLRAVVYVIAQCLGAIAGAGILYGLTPGEARGGLGVLRVHHELGLGQSFGVEFMITFLLVFTVFANLDPKRADMGSRSLAIGLSVVLGHLFALPYTGAGMNPARALGPAVIMNTWSDHWVYWVGPLLGGIIGGFTYEYTHDSSNQLQYFKRSFRRRTNLRRNRNSFNSNSTISTELGITPTVTPKEEEPRI